MNNKSSQPDLDDMDDMDMDAPIPPKSKTGQSTDNQDEHQEDHQLAHATVDELIKKVNEVEAKLNDAESKLIREQDKTMRMQAELQNVRRGAAQDIQKAQKFANENLLIELLPVLDSLERSIETDVTEANNSQALREGIELTLKMFATVLEKAGVKKVHPQGESFNPDFHQAMAMQESSELEAGKVLQVLQAGYILNERLIRPALVIVAKAAAT